MEDTDPRLKQALLAHSEGRHDEALELLRALFGEVDAATLSIGRAHYFGLMFQWRMLLEDYPPARAPLIALRDRQVARLLDGDPGFGQRETTGIERSPSRFAVIVEMNDMLGDTRSTYEVFVRLDAAQPGLARAHAWRALPAVVDMGDFRLADRYRGDPLALLDVVNDNARTFPLMPPPRQAPRLAAELVNFMRDVRIGCAVLRGLGRADEADALRTVALAGLQAQAVREMGQRELDEPGVIFRELAGREAAQAS